MTAVRELAAAADTAEPEHPGRPAAGENPAKRDQILDGAKRVFIDQGYDGASMNDITRAAGVSKGTIYVYFNSKEDLFVGLIQRERERIFNTVQTVLDDSKPVEEVLYNFGMVFARHMTAPNTIRGMRMALGVLNQMPEVANGFLTCGPAKGAVQLKDYLARRVEAGELKIDDTMLAARQFSDLCIAGLFRPAMFGEYAGAPSDEEMDHVIRSGLHMFLKTYKAP